MISLDSLKRGARQEDGSTLDRPLDHLMACHRRIEERLSTLERVGVHLADHRQEALEAAANCFRFFETNGVYHTEDEEASLFPRMQPRLSTDEQAYLHELEFQHRQAEEIYAALRSEVAELERGAGDPQRYQMLANQLASLYRAHIASEDQILTALGSRVLTQQELTQIAREMKARRGLAAGGDSGAGTIKE